MWYNIKKRGRKVKKFYSLLKEGALFEKTFDQILAKTRYKGKNLNRIKFVIDDKRKLYLYKKLKKSIFDSYIQDFEKENANEKYNVKKGDTIWFCWLQGIENAPDLIKCCYNSIKKNLCENGEYKIQVITQDNYSEFATLPDYIIEKYNKGVISRAHFADILRLKLLIDNGGVWIDSTVLFTDNKRFNLFKDSNLVMPNRFSWHAGRLLTVDNWFILAKTNNKILKVVYGLLLKYWEKYDYLMDYFFCQVFFAMTFDFYPDELVNMPYFSAHTCEYLGEKLFEEYDENRYKLLLSQSDFFKLSFKFPKSSFEKENTNYKHILEVYLDKQG